MSDPGARVGGIDHVELTVSDREAAAAWFADVLGLERYEPLSSWAENGPLMLTSDGGATKLALFEDESKTPDAATSTDRVAFGIDGAGFLAFVDRVADRSDVEVGGRADIVDHDLAYSVYFTGPSGSRFEVTTDDHEYVASRR